MNYFLAQIILARNKDIESWTNILFIVVLAAFYVIGSIVKARANKFGKQKQGRERPGHKLPEPTPGAPKPLAKTLFRQAQRPVGPAPKSQPPPQAQPPRRKIVRPQPVAEKVAAKKPEIRPRIFEPSEVPKLSPLTPQLQPDLEELPEFTVETVKKLGDKRISMPAETPQAKYLTEILLDYDDPDSLRRAILHYEILGKPLSLRGPGEHII